MKTAQWSFRGGSRGNAVPIVRKLAECMRTAFPLLKSPMPYDYTFGNCCALKIQLIHLVTFQIFKICRASKHPLWEQGARPSATRVLHFTLSVRAPVFLLFNFTKWPVKRPATDLCQWNWRFFLLFPSGEWWVVWGFLPKRNCHGKEYDVRTMVFRYTLNKWQNCSYS